MFSMKQMSTVKMCQWILTRCVLVGVAIICPLGYFHVNKQNELSENNHDDDDFESKVNSASKVQRVA